MLNPSQSNAQSQSSRTFRSLTWSTLLSAALCSVVACCGPDGECENPNNELEINQQDPDGNNDGERAGDGDTEQDDTIRLHAGSNLEVRLNQLLYGAGDTAEASLHISGPATLTDERVPVLLVGAKGEDIEYVVLRRSADRSVYETEDAVPIESGDSLPVEQYDGVLVLRPNEMFTAFYYPDADKDGALLSGEQIVADIGIMRAGSILGTTYDVVPDIALTPNELSPPRGGKPLGTLATANALPLQLPVDELIIHPKDEDQLQRFLDETGGEVLMTNALHVDPTIDAGPGAMAPGTVQAGPQPEPPTAPSPVEATPIPEPPNRPTAYLVRVNTSEVDLGDLTQMRALHGEDDTLLGSNEEVLRIFAMAMKFRLDGMVVGVNPRMQPHGVPTTPDSVSASATDNRFEIPQMWAHNALWDADERTVRAAFIDMGFILNPDYRGFESPDDIWQCDLEGSGLVSGLLTGVSCGPRVAEGPPTVGNSFFGDRTWHGTGVVATAGGVINNGRAGMPTPGEDHAFAGGTGGQVLEPMLYRMGLASYAFEIGLGIEKAALDGASVINVSAGYPCRLVVNVIPDPNICTVGGRAAICAAVTATLIATSAAVCAAAAATAAIPFVGPIIAAPLFAVCAVTTAVSVAASVACFSTLIAGDLQSNMARGVNAALDRGVVVVTSAGNRINEDNLPDIILEVLDTDNIDVDDWGVIPCVIDGTICVGATNNVSPWENLHYAGDSVDIWAPIRSNFFAPSDPDTMDPHDLHVFDTIGGTSAAAPYITGLITVMMAFDPALDPANPALTPAARRAIPNQLRTLLTSTAYTDSDTTNPLPFDADRRNLVNPPLLISTASLRTIPNFMAMGYDTAMNFDETNPTAAKDTEATAQRLETGNEAIGTIVAIPGTRGGVNISDVDWYRHTIPAGRPGLYRGVIELTTPRDRGNLWISCPDFVLGVREVAAPSPDERTVQYRTPVLFHGTEFAMQVRPTVGDVHDDNVYKIRVLSAEFVSEVPDADRFDVDDAAVNPPESRPNNNDRAHAVHLGIHDFTWAFEAGIVGTRSTYRIDIDDLNFHQPGDVDWFSIEHLPPFNDYRSPGCQPMLEVHFGDNMRLVLLGADGSEVYTAEASPAIIPASYIRAPVEFRLEPDTTGVFVEYDLSLQFVPPFDAICRLEFIAVLDEIYHFHRLGFPRFHPDEVPELTGQFDDLTNLVVNPAPMRRFDEFGRVLTPDAYFVRHDNSQPLHIAAELLSGESLAMTLLDEHGNVVEQVGTADLDDMPAGTSGPGADLQLMADGLPSGDYFLLISHATPRTQLDLHVLNGVEGREPF